MGRPRSEVDVEKMMDLLETGWAEKDIAKELGVSTPTLAKRIGELQQRQGVLFKYRAVQSLQLTELQAKVLEAITDEKISEAPLKDLVGAYKILKDKELTIEGKPSEIKGLVSYLVEMEKRDLALNDKTIDVTEVSKGGNGDGKVTGFDGIGEDDMNLQDGDILQ